MSNSAAQVFNRIFNGASPQGSVENAYFALTLLLLESRNASETLANPAAELVRQLTALAGEDSLAVKDFAQRVNYIRDSYRG